MKLHFYHRTSAVSTRTGIAEETMAFQCSPALSFLSSSEQRQIEHQSTHGYKTVLHIAGVMPQSQQHLTWFGGPTYAFLRLVLRT